MPIRNILVALDGSPSSVTALGAAVSMQKAYGAHVTGFVALPGDLPGGEGSAWLPAAIRKTLQSATAEKVAEIRAAFGNATAGLAGDRVHLAGQHHASDTSVAEASRYFDVTLVGIADARSRRSALHPDRIALLGGRPVLAFPAGTDTSRVARRVAVAWDGSRAAARSLSSAVRLLEAKEKVTIVTVGGPGAARAQAQGLDPKTMLSRHGVPADWVHAVPGPGGIAATILAECARLGAELLIMGAYERSKLREDLVGGVTHDVLAATRIPVFLEH